MTEIKTRCLSEISEVITKGTTPTTMGYSFEKSGINFLKIESFDEFGKLIPDKVAFVSEECHEKFKRSQLKKDDVLFSIAGAIGRVSIVTEDMLPANTNQALAIIRINNKSVYIPYIRLILTSNIVKKQIEKQKQGVAQINLSLKNIGDLEIPLPSYDEQVQYVEIFDKIIRIINNRKKQVELLDILIKSRFVEMFGDSSYETKSLTELTDTITKGTTPTTVGYHFVDKGINFFKIESINDDHTINLNKVAYVDEACHNAFKRSQLREGDILFSIAGAIGRTAIITLSDLPGNINQALAIIRLQKDCRLQQRFLITALESPMVVEQYDKKKRGIAQINLSLQDINNLKIMIPPINLQNEFSDFCRQLDKLKFVVQQSINVTQQLFDSLMQEYFG